MAHTPTHADLATEREAALLLALLEHFQRADAQKAPLRWEELPQRDPALAKATPEELRSTVRHLAASRWLEGFADSGPAFRLDGVTKEGIRQTAVLQGKNTDPNSFKGRAVTMYLPLSIAFGLTYINTRSKINLIALAFFVIYFTAVELLDIWLKRRKERRSR